MLTCQMAAATAAGGAGKEKEPPNEVHQNAIFRETVAKEKRHQKLFAKFTYNPYNNDCKSKLLGFGQSPCSSYPVPKAMQSVWATDHKNLCFKMVIPTP